MTAFGIRHVISVLGYLMDPRLDEEVMAGIVEGMDEETAKDVLTAAMAWISTAIESSAEEKGIDVGELITIIRDGLDGSIADLDRLDHEGGLFT